MMQNEKIAVTGIGVVSPFGRGTQPFIDALKEGMVGKNQVIRFDVTDPHYQQHFACNIQHELEEQLEELDSTKISTLALWACKEALEQSGLCTSNFDPFEIGLSMGTSHGGNHSLIKYLKQRWVEKNGKVDHSLLFNTSATVAGNVAKNLGISGPVITISTACSSGTTSLGYAMDLLMNHETDIMIAGGADLISELSFSGFNSLQAICEDLPRPFSKTRTGLMLGEGAAFMVLERLEDAQERDANILAQLVGYAINNDAYHPTAPHPEGNGAFEVMKAALENAGITIEDIDYINMHGTSTQANDPMELKAVKRLFENRLDDICLSSTKSMIGHALGAAGSLEAAATILAMREELVLPTMNFQEPIEEFEEINVVPNHTLQRNTHYALSNSFAFAGHMASIVIKNNQS